MKTRLQLLQEAGDDLLDSAYSKAGSPEYEGYPSLNAVPRFRQALDSSRAGGDSFYIGNFKPLPAVLKTLGAGVGRYHIRFSNEYGIDIEASGDVDKLDDLDNRDGTLHIWWDSDLPKRKGRPHADLRFSQINTIEAA